MNSSLDVYAVEKIVGRRHRKNKIEYLIKWQNWDEKYNTWEPSSNILDKQLIECYNRDHTPFSKKKRKSSSLNRSSSPNTEHIKKDENEENLQNSIEPTKNDTHNNVEEAQVLPKLFVTKCADGSFYKINQSPTLTPYTPSASPNIAEFENYKKTQKHKIENEKLQSHFSTPKKSKKCLGKSKKKIKKGFRHSPTNNGTSFTMHDADDCGFQTMFPEAENNRYDVYKEDGNEELYRKFFNLDETPVFCGFDVTVSHVLARNERALFVEFNNDNEFLGSSCSINSFRADSFNNDTFVNGKAAFTITKNDEKLDLGPLHVEIKEEPQEFKVHNSQSGLSPLYVSIPPSAIDMNKSHENINSSWNSVNENCVPVIGEASSLQKRCSKELQCSAESDIDVGSPNISVNHTNQHINQVFNVSNTKIVIPPHGHNNNATQGNNLNIVTPQATPMQIPQQTLIIPNNNNNFVPSNIFHCQPYQTVTNGGQQFIPHIIQPSLPPNIVPALIQNPQLLNQNYHIPLTNSNLQGTTFLPSATHLQPTLNQPLIQSNPQQPNILSQLNSLLNLSLSPQIINPMQNTSNLNYLNNLINANLVRLLLESASQNNASQVINGVLSNNNNNINTNNCNNNNVNMQQIDGKTKLNQPSSSLNNKIQ